MQRHVAKTKVIKRQCKDSLCAGNTRPQVMGLKEGRLPITLQITSSINQRVAREAHTAQTRKRLGIGITKVVAHKYVWQCGYDLYEETQENTVFKCHVV